jgi:hypothetical protein
MTHHRFRALTVEGRSDEVGDRLQPLALLAREGADRGRMYGDDPEGA